MIAGHDRVGILWEITADVAAAKAQVIAQVAIARSDVPQIVAIDDDHRRETDSLALRLCELGITAVVRTPESLQSVARLVHRQLR